MTCHARLVRVNRKGKSQGIDDIVPVAESGCAEVSCTDNKPVSRLGFERNGKNAGEHGSMEAVGKGLSIEEWVSGRSWASCDRRYVWQCTRDRGFSSNLCKEAGIAERITQTQTYNYGGQTLLAVSIARYYASCHCDLPKTRIGG